MILFKDSLSSNEQNLLKWKFFATPSLPLLLNNLLNYKSNNFFKKHLTFKQ